MKAIFLLSVLGCALAAPGALPINAQYVSATNGNCALKPGYAFYYTQTTPPTTTTSASTAASATATYTMTPTALGASTCQFTTGTGAANSNYFTFYCLANYSAIGLSSTATTGLVFGVDATGTTWTPSTGTAITGLTGPYDFGATTTFACNPIIPPACNYSCSTTGTGSGCVNGSGTAAVGALPQSLCNAGYFATVTSPSTATTSCPAGGLNTTTWVVTCSNTGYTTTAQWFLIASAQRGWSEPKSCNCATDPVCPSKNSNSPTCSKCNLSPCVQTNAGWGTPGAVRANTFAAAAFCPAGTTTLAGMYDCFEQAACGGAIAKGDICIFGVANQAGTAACPTCPSGSKKGLLGLLGLLGLIPLLLCSSLLCLLLFCIRRNKKERDVHFATFDAGAPAVVAPVCHDFPVAHQTQTVHHATYVGPQHCAVPSGFGY